MTVEILEPHGFCAGVAGALEKTRRLSGPVYCLHALVHNEQVVADLARRGFVFVETLAAVPAGATVLLSAHGVAPCVRAAAAARGLRVVDATCPFVARVHAAARRFAECGLPVIVIGRAAHVEVQGILGEIAAAGGRSYALDGVAAVAALARRLGAAGTVRPRVGVVSQTTMNADDVAAVVAALRARLDVETLAEVCRATKERQDAVKAFTGDALLVLGSAQSSNTRRLCEVARCRAFRAATLEELEALDFSGVARLGVTSGASTPESFFSEAVRRLTGRCAPPASPPAAVCGIIYPDE